MKELVLAGLLLTGTQGQAAQFFQPMEFTMQFNRAAPDCLPPDHPFRKLPRALYMTEVIPSENPLTASGVAVCGAIVKILRPANAQGRDCSIWSGDEELCLTKYVFENPDSSRLKCTFARSLSTDGIGFGGCETTSLHAAY